MPDGGVPGNSIDQRIERTIAAILFFEREGGTEKSGPFRAHKMIQATLSPKRERGENSPGADASGSQLALTKVISLADAVRAAQADPALGLMPHRSRRPR